MAKPPELLRRVLMDTHPDAPVYWSEGSNWVRYSRDGDFWEWNINSIPGDSDMIENVLAALRGAGVIEP
jgi:hypothetical protein